MTRYEILNRMSGEEMFRVMDDLGFFDPVRGIIPPEDMEHLKEMTDESFGRS